MVGANIIIRLWFVSSLHSALFRNIRSVSALMEIPTI